MTDLEQICKQVSKDLNENYDLVKTICQYQFQFIRNVMQDPNDTHNILLEKLFKFKLKPRFKHENDCSDV